VVEIVGREDELSQIADFARAGAAAGALLLDGEAGIGKTTLWRAGIALAEEHGFRVLTSRPAGAEAQLSFAALRDLVDSCFEEAADVLPAPQRRALAVALLREEPGKRPPPDGAVAAALVALLRHAARERPVLVAVDDVHWLDPPSADLLAFAARRLGHAQVAILAARRSNGWTVPPLGLDRSFEDRFSRVSVGPLSLGAVHRLVRDRLRLPLSRPALRRIHDVSAGNPFYALELAKALAENGTGAAGLHLPLPPTMQELLGDRLTELPEPTREALLLAAASARPTMELLEKALGVDATGLIEPAIANEIVDLTDGAIHFVHPLFASAMYEAAGESSRRRAHELLADASSDLEERARHLALSSSRPDAGVAGLLDEAAHAARTSGAPAAAAELLEQAIAKTPAYDIDGRAARKLDAAAALMIAGDARKARALLGETVATLDAGPLRSDALALLSELVAGDEEGGERRRALIEQSLHEAGPDPRRRAEALLRYDIWERSQDRLPEALEAARAAVELAEEVGDESLLARALTRRVDLEFLLGLADDPHLHFSRALELDEKLQIDPYLGPRSMLAVCLVRTGRVDEARPLLLTQHARALAEGNEEARVMLCLFLAELEWLAGRWTEAAERAAEGIELAEQSGARLPYGALLSVLALVEASRGEVGAARSHAREGVDLCESMIETAYALQNRYVLGFLELSLGNPGEAVKHLSALGSDRPVEGTKRIAFIGDEIEALVQVGEIETARVLADELERRGHDLHRPVLVAIAARCRAMAAVPGEVWPAASQLEGALEAFAALNLPFERARTLLVLGQVQRRAKQKRAARESLEQAADMFDALGAPLWAEKARAELGRISGRVRSDGLTPTEQRIAELVAQGRSNKEVSAELFVTVKTVERNLSRIYEKLGVRSRTELARQYARR
jgi:DNA-binding CsgD family transcriptional regulator